MLDAIGRAFERMTANPTSLLPSVHSRSGLGGPDARRFRTDAHAHAAARDGHDALAGRPRALLLQGPVGPFFNRLAVALHARGYCVDRVCLNGADRLSIRRVGEGKRLVFSEEPEHLEGWMRATLAQGGYEMVVLFGCQRPAHVAAVSAAKEWDLPVISLEEGYIRTGFVTVERGGNNAASPIAGLIPETIEPRGVGSSRASPSKVWMGFDSAVYFTLRNLLTPPAQRALFHKRRSLVFETLAFVRSILRWSSMEVRRRLLGRSVARDMLERRHGRYDLVILQVPDDAQMGAAARGWTNQELVKSAIESFARFAPPDRHLVFKIHPHERGHTKDQHLIELFAAQWDVADRVHWLYTGNLADIASGARGMIVINSTSGFSAIAKGIPLLVLGDAIYDHPRLVRTGEERKDIDAFWTDGFVADRELRRAYHGWLVEKALVEGDFYARRTMTLTAGNVAERAIELAREARDAGAVAAAPSRPGRTDRVVRFRPAAARPASG